MPVEDRRFLGRAFGIAVRNLLVFAAIAASFVLLLRFYSDKFYDRTGQAEWIWQPHRFATREPVAFFATRDIDLGPAPSWVRIKVAADPEYTLFFNGREIAGGTTSRATIDEYEVSSLARPGRNRIVASIRSPEGVGGFLLSVDLQPERQNVFVTDGRWKIFRRWDDRLLLRDVAGGEAPLIIGQPPMGKWNYPATRQGTPYGEERFVGYAVARSSIRSSIPEIRIIRGVPVTSRVAAEAQLFDFGRSVEGRGRIEMVAARPEVVRVRYVDSLDEIDSAPIRSLVVAGGERAVLDPMRRRFRYVVLFEPRASANVVSEAPM